jgi:hypothetical protein
LDGPTGSTPSSKRRLPSHACGQALKMRRASFIADEAARPEVDDGAMGEDREVRGSSDARGIDS